MSFAPTEEQRLLDDTLTRLLERHWDPRREADTCSGQVADTAVWAAMREAGLLGLGIPESFGGGGMGAAELSVLFRRFGRQQMRSPFLGSAVLAGTALMQAPQGPLRERLLHGLASGAWRASLALLEDGARYDYRHMTLDAAAGQLSGRKRSVLEGDSADWLIVSCRREGEPALVAIERKADGVTATPYAAFDGTTLATLDFQRVAVAGDAVLARGPAALVALENAMALGALAAASEILGACEGAFQQTLDYLRVREQFGTPLARFQALQHRASDLHADMEMLRSLVLGAAQALAEADARGHGEAFAAMALAVDVGDRVCREAIQMHGGIGMTRELGIGQYLLRVNALSRLFGDAPHCANLYLQTLEESFDE